MITQQLILAIQAIKHDHCFSFRKLNYPISTHGSDTLQTI